MNMLPNEVLWKDGDLLGMEFFQNGEGQGQFGQHYPPSFLERLFIKVDRDADRREQDALQTDRAEQLVEETTDERRMQAWRLNQAVRKKHGRRSRPALVWNGNDEDPSIYDMKKEPDKVIAYQWMVNYIAYRNNEIKHRRALIEALKNDPDKVIAYVSESLLRLCKNAALETGKEINVDFRTMPAEIVDHLKVHFAKEM